MINLTVTGYHDYRSELPGPIDEIAFAAPADAVATFSASQISPVVVIHGDDHPDFIEVWLDAPGTFSAAGWTFDGWPDDGAHEVDIFGTKEDDRITGSHGANDIWGGGGADHLIGGPSTDIFRYRFAYEIAPGETIDGGGGVGRIVIEGGGTYDFTGASIANVGQLGFLAYDGDFATAIFRGDQFGAGHINFVRTGPYATPTLIVKGAAVDLSTVTFGLGGADINVIRIVGTPGDDFLRGSSLWDRIEGGAGDDRIRGLDGPDTLVGGAGNDRISGGADRDIFLFNAGLNPATNVDHIDDFAHLTDGFTLKHTVFAAIPAGGLARTDFHLGTAAADAGDRIIYDQPTGRLYYDPDGTGARAQVLFAVLDNHAAITSVDFLIS